VIRRLLLLALLAPLPLQAGPVTTVITGLTAYGGQTTLNNSWSQSFMAVGNAAASDGGSSISPFTTSESGPADAPPATLFELSITLEPENSRANASAISGYSLRAGREDPGNTPRSITTLGIGELQLVADPGDQLETIAGQVDGRNLGTETLSVFGRQDTIPRRQDTTLSWF
jgi:hypothetical protein